MIRVVISAAALALGISVVAAQQDVPKERQNLMNSFARPHYGVLSRTAKGTNAYDRAAIDAALLQIEELTKKIPAVFPDTAKGDVPDAKYGTSPKVWENKADFDSKITAMQKAVAGQKGKIKDVDSLKAGYKAIDDACESCHDTYRVRKG